MAAAADMDVELALDRAARDLDLVLVGDVGFLDGPAAVGAGERQRCLVDFVDGGGWLPMGLGAVSRTGLAAGLLGLVGRQALGEGGGLALAGAGRLVELAAEAVVLGLQVAKASLKGLAAGTRDGVHTRIIGVAQALAAQPRPRPRDQLELDALNKYLLSCSIPNTQPAKTLGVVGRNPWPQNLHPPTRHPRPGQGSFARVGLPARPLTAPGRPDPVCSGGSFFS
jgi:hypothetical protein